MPTKNPTTWKPGMDLPYVIPFGERGMLAISLRAAWLKPDRSGRPLLLPPAVRALDRLRAMFTTPVQITPGFILSLREAMGLTQQQFGQKLHVSKMTVSRWECGKMRPSPPTAAAIRSLQTRSKYKGLKINDEKPANAIQAS